MLVPVNLYVDRMSPVQPVRVADVYAVTQDRAAVYREAAAKIGLTVHEYAEFRDALTDGSAVYGELPRRIDAMAGVHRRTGHVYALRNVLVPRGTMGWRIGLADGTVVLVPQICGNLSMNHGHPIAHHTVPHRSPVLARAVKPIVPTPVDFAPVPVAATPVVFTGDGGGVPIAAAAPIAAAHVSALEYLAPLIPLIITLGTGPKPTLPPCSAGSNEFGACSR